MLQQIRVPILYTALLVYYLKLSYQVYLDISRSRTEAKRASPSLLIASCPSLLKAEQFDNSLQSLQNLVPRQLCR